MRTLSVLILLCAGTTTWCQTTTAHAPFSITISTESAEVKAGSGVHLKIQMTNTSDHDVNCSGSPSNGLDRAYRYDVRDEDGKPAAKIARKHPEIGESFSFWPCSIKPGQTASAAGGLITVLYDLTRPGRYTIQVSRPISDQDPKSGVVYSNKIIVTVTS
jgi:hypothetical protein